MKADENLLSLNEYALKYDVSVSTLRRRIKKDAIEYVFDDGKYWIKDIDLEQQDVAVSSNKVIAPPQKDDEPKLKVESKNSNEPSAFVAASKILEELKATYSQNLQTKDEHINTLKEEIADLKTLIKVLEQENDRLKRLSTEDRLFESMKDQDFKF
ncbi:MAG: hypothetical protein MK008_00795 [Bdellovibrionales bacterium]|nr:hypothetical protein [Bdellovibrionales bacterium]